MSLVGQLLDPDEFMRLDEADLGRLEAAASAAVLKEAAVKERLAGEVQAWGRSLREKG
jgi:hypothetical protein